MATEAQKILHAYKEGLKFGAVEGAQQMRDRIYDLVAEKAPEIAEEIKAVKIDWMK